MTITSPPDTLNLHSREKTRSPSTYVGSMEDPFTVNTFMNRENITTQTTTANTAASIHSQIDTAVFLLFSSIVLPDFPNYNRKEGTGVPSRMLKVRFFP